MVKCDISKVVTCKFNVCYFAIKQNSTIVVNSSLSDTSTAFVTSCKKRSVNQEHYLALPYY